MKKAFVFLCFLAFLAAGVDTLAAQPLYDAAPHPGKKLIVGVVQDPPYIIKEGDGQWSGLNVEIWKSIARDMKIDYEFREMTFKELLEGLKGGTIDISIEAFFVLAERQRLIDYSIAFGTTRLALATLPDKIPHPWWAALAIVLSWATLKSVILLGLILCFLGFLFWLVERRANPDHFGGHPIHGIATGIYWVGSTMASGVCFGVALKSLAARLLGLTWMLVCAVALSALIASLTTALSQSRAMTQVVSDESLGRMRIGGVAESAESKVLQSVAGECVLYSSETEALKAVRAGSIDAFLYDEITLHYLQAHQYRNRISVYPTKSLRFMFAFGLPKDSPMLRDVNCALLKLIESRDWGFFLGRYGLEPNFEQTKASEAEAIIRRPTDRN
jgi:ABC-type amino acid transport substrate-binding protein